MSYQRVSGLPAGRVLDLLFTYGRAYELVLRDVDRFLAKNSRYRNERSAGRRAAAMTIREHVLPHLTADQIEASEGDEGLAGFVVAMTRSWAQVVAGRDFYLQDVDAEDVAASVGWNLLRVMRSSDVGPWMTQPPVAPALGEWTRTAVRNEVTRRGRYRARRPEALMDSQDLASLAGAKGFESDMEIRDVVGRATAEVLSTTDRQVLDMVSHLGMSQVEVASALGVTPQAVNQRLGRIRARLPDLADALTVS